MRGTDGNIVLAQAAAGASPVFPLSGGRYQFAVPTATFGGGNIAVQMLACDGVTWLPVTVALSAVGMNVFETAAGSFRFFSVTATVFTASVARIPGE